MFGIGAPELAVILILALIVFGPEKLPQIAGQVARSVREFQRQASEIQSTFTDALNMAQLEEEQKKAQIEGGTATQNDAVIDSTPVAAITETPVMESTLEPHPAFLDAEQPALTSGIPEGEHGLAAHEQNGDAPAVEAGMATGMEPIAGATVPSPYDWHKPEPAKEKPADYII